MQLGHGSGLVFGRSWGELREMHGCHDVILALLLTGTHRRGPWLLAEWYTDGVAPPVGLSWATAPPSPILPVMRMSYSQRAATFGLLAHGRTVMPLGAGCLHAWEGP